MKQLTSLVILTGAATLVACASQAPAPSVDTGVSHETATATAAASSTPSSPSQAAVPATATATATASATAPSDKFQAPGDYKQVVVNGNKVYCHSVAPPDSRIKQTECFTQDQLQQMQTAAQNYMNSIQRADSVNVSNGPNTGGANGGGR